MLRLLIAAYLVEAGLMLVIAPWTPLWDRNYFAAVWPWLGTLMVSPYARGAVTGVGLVTLAAGLRELVAVIFRRRPPATVAPGADRSSP